MGAGEMDLVITDAVSTNSLFDDLEYQGEVKSFTYKDYYQELSGTYFKGKSQSGSDLEKRDYTIKGLQLSDKGYNGSGSISTKVSQNSLGETIETIVSESKDYYLNNKLASSTRVKSEVVEQQIDEIVSHKSEKERSFTKSYSVLGESYTGTIRSFDSILTGGIDTRSSHSQLEFFMKNLGDINEDSVSDYSVRLKEVQTSSLGEKAELQYTDYNLISEGSSYVVQDMILNTISNTTPSTDYTETGSILAIDASFATNISYTEALSLIGSVDTFADTVLILTEQQ
mgnify:CR=1 FL=1